MAYRVWSCKVVAFTNDPPAEFDTDARDAVENLMGWHRLKRAMVKSGWDLEELTPADLAYCHDENPDAPEFQ